MDIFSATSKQVETATTPKVATTTQQTRPVEQSSDTAKTNQNDQNDQSDTVKTLTQTVKDLNDQMDLLDTNISFGFNDEISLMYVNVTDKTTGETIRKIPTEEAMDLSAKMKEIVGMIFDKKG
jgi:flagellar protein FlaG